MRFGKCVSFCRVWKIKVCTSYNRHILRISMVTGLSSKKGDSVITHWLEVRTIIGIPV